MSSKERQWSVDTLRDVRYRKAIRVDHGIWPLDAVFADIAFLVGDVVQDERRHGGRAENDKMINSSKDARDAG